MRGWLLAWILGLGLGVAGTPSASADPVPTPTPSWGVDGSVNSIVTSGTTAYIGGNFSRIAPNTGGFAVFDATAGALNVSFPPVLGRVHEAITDGAGGWYLGGSFTHVGGVPRTNLAHLFADGSVDPAWASSAEGGAVFALARSGGVVYAGGSFDTVNGGTVRPALAAFDSATGALTSFATPIAALNADVDDVLVVGSRVVAGGIFDAAGKLNLAAFEANGTVVNSFEPDPGGEVFALARCDTAAVDILYAGGTFANAGGMPRAGLAAFENLSSTPSAWVPSFPLEKDALLVRQPSPTTCASAEVYVGGSGAPLGAAEVQSFFGTGTGTATGFLAKLGPTPIGGGPLNGGGIQAMALQSGKLYVAGGFSQAGDPLAKRLGAAAFDAATGALDPWDPGLGRTSGQVLEVANAGATIAVGGRFAVAGGVARANLGAIDLTTGLPTAFDPPQGTAIVNAVGLSGSTLYAGHGGLAPSANGYDPTTGAPTGFAAATNGPVRALAVDGATVHVGGAFTEAAGTPRGNLASFLDVPGTAGALLAPNPDLDGAVNALALGGGTLFAGGEFAHVNGSVPRNRIAAFDPASLTATGFDPNANAAVRALTLSAGTLSAGGDFSAVNGSLPRNNVASFDPATGVASAFDPNIGLPVHALATSGATTYGGGIFTQVNGATPRSFFAAFETLSGAALPFAPEPALPLGASDVAPVRALAIPSDGGLVLGGEFPALTAPFTMASGFAAFAGVPGPPGPDPEPPPDGDATTCRGKPATIVGTQGKDRVRGTKKVDVIATLGGNDNVRAGKGSDIVCAGKGSDKVSGEDGNDKLFGEQGRDRLLGQDGRDLTNGGPGRDTCNGGRAKDRSPGCERGPEA